MQFLPTACFEVLAVDAQRLVEAEADLPAARQIGLVPLVRVIAVLRFARVAGLGMLEDRRAQGLLLLAGDHMHLPRLDVVAAGRAGRELQQLLDGVSRHRPRMEAADGLAGTDGGVDMHAELSGVLTRI
ncbi:hypothetical protein D3C76_1276240 [compost metagenome]